MSFLSDAFGRTLKSLRSDQGIRQDKLGIAEGATVSRWESGQFLPGDDKIEEILKALKVEPDEFLRHMAGITNKPALEVSEILQELKSVPILVAYEKAKPDKQLHVRQILGLEAFSEPSLSDTSSTRKTR